MIAGVLVLAVFPPLSFSLSCRNCCRRRVRCRCRLVALPVLLLSRWMSSGGHGRGRGRGSLGLDDEARGPGRGRAQGRGRSTASFEDAQTSTGDRGRGLGVGTASGASTAASSAAGSRSTADGGGDGGGGGGGGRQRIYLVEKKGIKYFEPQFRTTSTISAIFRSFMHKDGFSWKLVPEEKKMEYFEEFKKVFHWEPVEEEPIKELWRKRAAIRYKNLISDFKVDYFARGNKPAYIPDSDWEGWIAYWERDDVKEKARKAKMCRLSEPEGPGTGIATHFGGSRSAHEYAEALEKNMPDEQVDWEVFLRIHSKNGDYTSAKSKRIDERVYQLAHERSELQDSSEEQEVDMNSIYIEVAKENNSKGRMLGLGDRASMYTSCGSHSTGGSLVSSGHDTEAMTQQLSSLQTEREQ